MWWQKRVELITNLAWDRAIARGMRRPAIHTTIVGDMASLTFNKERKSLSMIAPGADLASLPESAAVGAYYFTHPDGESEVIGPCPLLAVERVLAEMFPPVTPVPMPRKSLTAFLRKEAS